jgi:hypothetical protein
VYDPTNNDQSKQDCHHTHRRRVITLTCFLTMQNGLAATPKKLLVIGPIEFSRGFNASDLQRFLNGTAFGRLTHWDRTLNSSGHPYHGNVGRGASLRPLLATSAAVARGIPKRRIPARVQA